MHSLRHHSFGKKQHGAALMVMLVIMVMGAAAFLVSSLSKSTFGTARQETTSATLAQAKDALVGYAAKDNVVRTGELPCPDIDNDGQLTMNVDYSGSTCTSLLGRLPWKTLGLPDLRDAAGERLWYAVSDSFHANNTAVLNSNTAGTLTVSGNLSASNVIAIVFAPGQNLPGQDRSAANINTSSAYLESVLIAPTSFSLLTPDNQPGGNYTYNDQLMLITHDALFPSVEKIVAKRVRDELLQSSRAFWRPYPYAAPFNDPSSENSFVTASGTLYGLFPRHAVWTGLPSISLTGGSATIVCQQRQGNNSLANARLRCDISAIVDDPFVPPDPPSFTITGTLSPSLGLWRQYDISSSSEVRIKVKGPSCSAPDPSWGSTVNCGAATVPGVNATIAYTTNADGSVTVTLSGTLINAITRIELRDVVTDTAYSWFTQNEWHKVIYYAISPGYAAGGSSTCNPLPGTPSCLTVNGNGGGSDKHAVVVMTGNALAGQSRAASPLALCAATGTNISPSACLSNYLELENATSAGFIYENRPRSSTFNDQVIVVAP